MCVTQNVCVCFNCRGSCVVHWLLSSALFSVIWADSYIYNMLPDWWPKTKESCFCGQTLTLSVCVCVCVCVCVTKARMCEYIQCVFCVYISEWKNRDGVYIDVLITADMEVWQSVLNVDDCVCVCVCVCVCERERKKERKAHTYGFQNAPRCQWTREGGCIAWHQSCGQIVQTLCVDLSPLTPDTREMPSCILLPWDQPQMLITKGACSDAATIR